MDSLRGACPVARVAAIIRHRHGTPERSELAGDWATGLLQHARQTRQQRTMRLCRADRQGLRQRAASTRERDVVEYVVGVAPSTYREWG